MPMLNAKRLHIAVFCVVWQQSGSSITLASRPGRHA